MTIPTKLYINPDQYSDSEEFKIRFARLEKSETYREEFVPSFPIEELKKSYERKINEVSAWINAETNSETKQRLITKKEEWRCFVTELNRLL